MQASIQVHTTKSNNEPKMISKRLEYNMAKSGYILP